MRSELYQLSLIFLLVVTTILFGIFLSREVYPQYKQFQQTYIALEEFRSTITHENPAPFDIGIRQIVLPQEHNGPEIVDRCTSCHVALQLAHFSPTKIATDVNGQVVLDKEGYPVKVANENYVWQLLDDRVAALSDEKALEALKEHSDEAQVKERIAEADKLKALKSAWVGDRQVDMTKAIAMHPLIGKESRPFEFHPVEEYGCTVCHSGNGRALTIEKAHGPVFDGQYPESFEGPEPQFLEVDPDNDPIFSKIFNHKPGHKLLFQTTPIFPGELIQANCVQCHLSSSSQLQGAISTVTNLKNQTAQQAQDVQKAYNTEKKALITLLTLRKAINSQGYDATLKAVTARETEYSLPQTERGEAAAQAAFLRVAVGNIPAVDNLARQTAALKYIEGQILASLGTQKIADELDKSVWAQPTAADATIDKFVEAHKDTQGHLFAKAAAAERQQIFLHHIGKAESGLSISLAQDQVKQAVTGDVDRMIQCYERGEQLYISQACYACHRIAGLARGGVGPELTAEGFKYPWFVKESVVWPQADLPTSTMPNYKLDHEELEAITCFLLGQRGRPHAISQVDYDVIVKQWEEGKKKQSFELPVPAAKIHDLRFGMTIFATQGCSACHRLKGFESNVGFAIEKGHEPTFAEMYKQHEWFSGLFPEEALGSQIVQAIDDHADEIDHRIADGVRQGSIIEEIEEKHPGIIEALYSDFKFASRAKNAYYQQAAAKAASAQEKAAALAQLNQWKERVERVLKMYIQEYGLGRLVGPRPNWSGIYRSDEWLMEHFYNPVTHVARSIMPVFPFDETKFYTLTYMLDTLAPRNAAVERELWDNRGFNPEVAYHINCAQCHGDYRQGDGPVAQWLYPIPKNLRNANFLQNLTKERVIESITHGVKGTPMPPWGELAKDKIHGNTTPVFTSQEIKRLADWLFIGIPEEDNSQTQPLKWHYQPEDVLRELHQEGDVLRGSALYDAEGAAKFLAALKPMTTPDPNAQHVSDVFDIKPYPVSGVDRKAYYIKQKYYTPENLAAGEKSFIENCAICHGKEGAGNGLRAGTMTESKPRMLTNLDWINTRDDLRLIQSIKYGVPGTAMIPWGDFTNSLQRLQLVMYIRSLSEEHALREHLAEVLYHSFDRAVDTVRQQQIVQYGILQKLQDAYQAAHSFKEDQEAKLALDQTAVPALVKAYQNELSLAEQVKKQQAIDDVFQKLIEEIKQSKDIYNILGTSALTNAGQGDISDQIVDLVGLNATHYDYNDGKLSLDPYSPDAQKIVAGGKNVIVLINQQIAAIQKEKKLLEGQIPSAAGREHLTELEQRLKSFQQLEILLMTTLEDAARSRQNQTKLVEQVNEFIEAAKPLKSHT